MRVMPYVCVLYMHFIEYIIYMKESKADEPPSPEKETPCYCVCVCECVCGVVACVCVKTFFEVKFNLHKTDKKIKKK